MIIKIKLINSNPPSGAHETGFTVGNEYIVLGFSSSLQAFTIDDSGSLAGTANPVPNAYGAWQLMSVTDVTGVQIY